MGLIGRRRKNIINNEGSAALLKMLTFSKLSEALRKFKM
jgi:hypothetical protein